HELKGQDGPDAVQDPEPAQNGTKDPQDARPCRCGAGTQGPRLRGRRDGGVVHGDGSLASPGWPPKARYHPSNSANPPVIAPPTPQTPTTPPLSAPQPPWCPPHCPVQCFHLSLGARARGC